MGLEGTGTLQSHLSSPNLCLRGQKFVLFQDTCQCLLRSCLWCKREASKQPQRRSCARHRERLLPLLAFNLIKFLWAKSSSGPHFINWQCSGLSNVPRSPGCLIHVREFIHLAMWLPSSGGLWNFSAVFKTLLSPTGGGSWLPSSSGCWGPSSPGDRGWISSFFRHSDLCPYSLLPGLLL